jgi:hypothetical protein
MYGFDCISDAPWLFCRAGLIIAVVVDPDADLSGASEDGDVYGPIKKAGKFLETQRTEGMLFVRFITFQCFMV